ncbi:MAG: tetratricopeptide repeat protein [Planctomycetota bacterium]|jgi:tetratricopeptide (TPR) repeat protein
MASRVNTKFLLILAVCTIFVVGLVGGLFYLQYRGDAERHIRRGDELMQAGEFREAHSAYGRAVSKNRSSLEYLEKFTDALLQIEPRNTDDAKDLYAKRLGALQQAVRYHGDEAAPHIALLEELLLAARLMTDNEDRWSELGEAADAMSEQVLEDDPDRIEAKLYGGIATFRRSLQITDTELETAEVDLREYLSAHPDSDVGWSALIRCHLAMSEKFRLDGAEAVADVHLQSAIDAAEEARTQLPEGPDVARATALAAIWQHRYDPEALSADEVREAIDRMERLVANFGDGLLVLDTAEVLWTQDEQLAGGERSFSERAVSLLDGYVEEHPDAVFHRLNLARFQYSLDRFDEATTNARHLAEGEQWLPVSFASRYQPQLRKQAAFLLVDIAMERWQDAPDGDKRAMLEGLQQAVADLETHALDPENDVLYIEADGLLAFAQSDYRRSAARFEQLSRDPQAVSQRILMYLARSLEEIGEFGRAYEVLKQLVAARPNNTQYLYACATSAFALRRYEDARRWAEDVLDLEPDYDEARRLLSVIIAQLGGGGDDSLDEVAQALKDAEIAMAEGKIESARATLLSVLAEDPENTPVLMALLRAEVTAGRTEQAQRYVDDLLERYPENRGLRQIAASLQADNRVQAIEQYVDSLELPEAERLVNVLTHLEALSNMQRGRAAQLEAVDRSEEAAEANALADEADEAAARYVQQAEEVASDHPQLQEYLFRQALRERNWTRAEQLVQRARTKNTDLAHGDLFAGQLALAREQDEDAVRFLTAAVREIPYSSTAWRALALAQQRRGNFGEAKTAFEQAYTNNPNDVDTVQRYVNLLQRTGDTTAALRIMRTAHRLVPDDLQLREAWLQLETVAGDPAVAMKRRRQIFAENPEDRSNAKQLATFLATARPTRQLMLDRDANERFNDQAWNRLSPIEQQQQVLQTKAQWFRDAQAILDSLEGQDGPRLSVVTLRAVLLREQGMVEEGLEVLGSFVESALEGATSTEALNMLLALGFFQSEIGRIDEAVATLEGARQHQDPVEREADQALGNLYFSRSEFEEALEAYSPPTESTELRVIECLASLGRFPEAEQRLQARMQQGEAGYPEQMLAAAIYNGYGQALHSTGQRDEARRMFERRDDAWNSAEQLSPSNTGPHIQRALAKLSDYQRAMEPSSRRDPQAALLILDDALAALDRADRIRVGDVQTAMTRVVILQAKGDDGAAISELTRLVEANPNEVAARRRLVQLQNSLGNFDEAIEAVGAGKRRNPALTVWHELEGDLYLEQVLDLQQRIPTMGDAQRSMVRQEMATFAGNAAAAYRQAVELDPKPPLLGKLVGARRGRRAWRRRRGDDQESVRPGAERRRRSQQGDRGAERGLPQPAGGGHHVGHRGDDPVVPRRRGRVRRTSGRGDRAFRDGPRAAGAGRVRAQLARAAPRAPRHVRERPPGARAAAPGRRSLRRRGQARPGRPAV